MSAVAWHDAVMAEAVDVLREHALADERAAIVRSMVLEHFAECAYSAAHDPLTGLANRAHIQATLDVLTEPGRAGSVAVLYVDLDHFKPVNDRLGHGVGDLVLAEVAKRLVAAAGPCEAVGRLGGDEFVVVYRCVAPRLIGSLARCRIASRLAAPIRVDGKVVRLRASVGLAVASCGDELSTAALLRLADLDMLERKRLSRSVSA